MDSEYTNFYKPIINPLKSKKIIETFELFKDHLDTMIKIVKTNDYNEDSIDELYKMIDKYFNDTNLESDNNSMTTFDDDYQKFLNFGKKIKNSSNSKEDDSDNDSDIAILFDDVNKEKNKKIFENITDAEPPKLEQIPKIELQKSITKNKESFYDIFINNKQVDKRVIKYNYDVFNKIHNYSVMTYCY